MNKQLTQVKEFQDSAGVTLADTPKLLNTVRGNFRINLMQEELREVIEAITNGDLSNLAKELADLLYVVNGTILEYGLGDKFDQIFNAVHASNMSKFDENGNAIRTPEGKIKKGPNYFEPNIDGILNPKVVNFSDIKLFGHFKLYDTNILAHADTFMKTSQTLGATQGDSIKHRNIYEFEPDCPVIEII